MAYALRSKGDPAPTTQEESLNTSASYLAEDQIMTSSINPIIPEELTQPLGLTLLAHTADQMQLATETESSLTSKSDSELHTQLDTQGPVRQDPGLTFPAPQLAGIPSATVPPQQLELAPAQASAFTPSASTTLHNIPETESGPPFPVALSHDQTPSSATAIASQPPQLYSSIEAPSTLPSSDSMESYNPKRAGISYNTSNAWQR